MLLTTAGDVLKGMLSEANLVKAGLAVVGLLFGLLIKKPLEDWWKNRGSLRQIRKDLYSAIADIENALAIYTTKLVYVLETYGEADAQLAISCGKIRGEAESFERVMADLTSSPKDLTAFSEQFHRELKVGHFDPKSRHAASEERAELDRGRLLREAIQAIDAARQARDDSVKRYAPPR